MAATGAQDDVCQREVENHKHIPMDFQLRGWICWGFVFGPIPNDPQKYFTEDVMQRLEEVVGKEFKYGSSVEEEESDGKITDREEV